MSFYKLGINHELVYALENQNIIEPTPIQKLSIPHILGGKDIIAEAQTGTGKTLAFLLPMFQSFDIGDPNIQGLIIAPTRELAIQISQVASILADIIPLNILAAYGGQDVNAQLHRLKGNIQLVIGTPGRILDHIGRGSINFDKLRTLVVDEADQIFQIGFKTDLKAIIKSLPSDRQTLCFSATLSHTIDSFTSTYLREPIHIKAPKKKITLENISQVVIETSNRRKFDDFLNLLKEENPKKAIVFTRTRMGASSLYEDMKSLGFNVEELHGALTQAKREFVMKAFKEGSIQYLVATDVAARGIDVDKLSHVFNYNLPDEAENYVHRIGRTGRAGCNGSSFIILTLKDEKRLEAIEEFINMKIERIKTRPEEKEKGQGTRLDNNRLNPKNKVQAKKKNNKPRHPKNSSSPKHDLKDSKRKSTSNSNSNSNSNNKRKSKNNIKSENTFTKNRCKKK